jgi:ribosomal protein S27AE
MKKPIEKLWEADDKAQIEADDEPTRCPHCGGTGGYLYKAHIYGTQWMTWEGDGVNFQDNGSRAFKKKCVDCGKGV